MISTINLYMFLVLIHLASLEDISRDDIISLKHLPLSYHKMPDKKVGERVKKWTVKSLVNPEELGSYAEGDMLDPPGPRSRSALTDLATRWPNATVPYVLSWDFSHDEEDLIYRAMEEYHDRTCIKFVERTTEPDYISIESSPTGCWSRVGRTRGKQIVNLQSPGCVRRIGTPIHEFMHALGFFHEHTRYDRDEFVKIKFENIGRGRENNFVKDDEKKTTTFGIPYDFNSVMHYSARAFSKNSKKTIVPRAWRRGLRMGQRFRFSPLDVDKVNVAYNCNKDDEKKNKTY